MQKIGIQNKAVNAARNYKDPGFSFTRRTIALLAITSIIVLPILAGIYNPYMPISYGFMESAGGGLFRSVTDQLSWATGTGIILGPIHTHLVYAIAGMYFGSSSVK